MAQLTINTQDFRDLYETAHIIQTLLVYNQKDLEFCPLKDYKELLEKYNNLEKKYAECVEDLDSAKKKLNEELARIYSLESQQKNHDQEIIELKSINKQLEDKNKKNEEELSKYKMDIGTSTAPLYLTVNGNMLEHTYIERSAFYIAVKKGEAYEFCYNEEKAAHMKAIESLASIIQPFCIIEGDVSPKEATSIVSRGKGLLTIENEKFVVESKAKIRLVR